MFSKLNMVSVYYYMHVAIKTETFCILSCDQPTPNAQEALIRVGESCCKRSRK